MKMLGTLLCIFIILTSQLVNERISKDILWEREIDGEIEHIFVSEDGKRVIVVSQYRTAYVLDQDGNETHSSIDIGDYLSVAVNEEGNRIFAGKHDKIDSWYVGQHEFGAGHWPETGDVIMLLARNGNLIYVLERENGFHIIRYDGIEKFYDCEGKIENFFFFPSGKLVLAQGWDENIDQWILNLCDISGNILGKISLDFVPTAYAFSHDDKSIFLGDAVGNIRIIRKERFLESSIAERDFLVEKNARIESISYLSDNELFATTKDDIGGICTIYYIKAENIAKDHKIHGSNQHIFLYQDRPYFICSSQNEFKAKIIFGGLEKDEIMIFWESTIDGRVNHLAGSENGNILVIGSSQYGKYGKDKISCFDTTINSRESLTLPENDSEEKKHKEDSVRIVKVTSEEENRFEKFVSWLEDLPFIRLIVVLSAMIAIPVALITIMIYFAGSKRT